MPATETGLYRIEDIEVDVAQRCVRRNGQEDRPRARVFDLLQYLIENRDRPVTRKELIDRVWGGVAVSDSVLYKTILEVRRALGDDAEEPVYIKTLPKLGYQFVGDVKPARVEPEPAAKKPIRQEISFWHLGLGIALAFVISGVAAYWFAERTLLPVPADDEIAWWRFNQGMGATLKDSVGSSHGQLVAAAAGGSPPHWAQGRRGSALSISGGNFVEGQIRVPKWSALTVAAWIRAEDPRPYEAMIFDSPRFGVFLVPNGIAMGRPAGVGAAADFAGKWRHIVAVDEGPITGIQRLYMDGSERASNSQPRFDGSPQMRWRMGQAFARSAPFRGLIDDLRIYERPLRRLEIQALYRCGKEQPDLTIAGKGYYYLPIYADGITAGADQSFTNGGVDMGGMQLAQQSTGCGVDDLRGADFGQDLRIGVDLLVSRDSQGHTTEAGPYFRSRRAYPGDGIAGGTSSGYWVKLSADGHVTLWQLRPLHVVAASSVPARFDPAAWHRLEVLAQKTEAQISLDGTPLDFEQDGRLVHKVAIQETGAGRGTAGVAFSADANRGLLGGQSARNLSIEPPK